MNDKFNDIHNFSRKLDRTIERVRNDEKVLIDNRDSILKFMNYCKAKNMKPPSILKDLYSLYFVAKISDKKFEKLSKEDAVEIINKVNSQNWTKWTKRSHRATFKKFFKWLKGFDEPNMYPQEVRWIPTGRKNLSSILPEEIITRNTSLTYHNIVNKNCDFRKHHS